MSTVTATCPGSCGELLQGWLAGSQKLVSYGIDRFTRVSVSAGTPEPQRSPKVQQAVLETLRQLALPLHLADELRIMVNSELPIAKGMASSTADIAATGGAVAAFFQQELTSDQLVAICLTIERTDSILFPSLTLFEQEQGRVQEISGWCPQFYVIVLEPEETIQTEKFHSPKTEALFYQQRHRFAKVYQQYEAAVQQQDLRLLGEAAFQSALLNQEILPKPGFQQLIQLKEEQQLLGINVAHSGSVVGLLVAERQQIVPVLQRLQQSSLPQWYTKISVHQSCYQGVQLA